MASTNAQQFNPTQANQENDAEYTVDATRTGGAGVDAIWPSVSANKTLYQVSTYVTALGTMLANKGIANSDANLAALTAAMSNIITTADIRGNLQFVGYSSTLLLNASAYLGFQIALTGNVASLSINGQQIGDVIVLLFDQDGTGGHTVAFSGSFVGAVQPDPTPNTISMQAFKVSDAYVVEAMGPNVSVNGVNNTPIGAVAPSTGAFTAFSASSSATAPTVSESDSSTRVATTAWVRGAFSSGSSGGAYWSKDPSGLIRQWGHASGLSTGSPNTVTFPIAFTNLASVNITATDDFYVGSSIEVSVIGNSAHGGAPPTLTQFQLWVSSSGNGAWWQAVGY
jgi:hypothetical protein